MNIESDKHVQVTLPDHQVSILHPIFSPEACSTNFKVVTVFLRDAMTVEEFLAAGCIKKGLSPVEHFIRVKKRRDMPNMNYFVPHRSDLIETYLSTHEVVEVCAKILYQVELARNTLNTMWGFSVEAELVENNEKQDELCCYVSRVEDRSVAMENGELEKEEKTSDNKTRLPINMDKPWIPHACRTLYITENQNNTSNDPNWESQDLRHLVLWDFV